MQSTALLRAICPTHTLHIILRIAQVMQSIVQDIMDAESYNLEVSPIPQIDCNTMHRMLLMQWKLIWCTGCTVSMHWMHCCKDKCSVPNFRPLIVVTSTRYHHHDHHHHDRHARQHPRHHDHHHHQQVQFWSHVFYSAVSCSKSVHHQLSKLISTVRCSYNSCIQRSIPSILPSYHI